MAQGTWTRAEEKWKTQGEAGSSSPGPPDPGLHSVDPGPGT